MARFDRIQNILNDALTAWSTRTGRQPDLSGHGQHFSWATKAELLAAIGHGRPLIQPELIGTANGEQAGLVIDLRTGFNGLRMPKAGPFVEDAKVNEIVQWIKDGCPD